MASTFDYRKNERYVFELADGHRITGEFRHKLFEETTGNLRNCFFRVAETNAEFFKNETYFEVFNVDEADTLVAFSLGSGQYGNRALVKNYRAVNIL
jgi:hypothetical protein